MAVSGEGATYSRKWANATQATQYTFVTAGDGTVNVCSSATTLPIVGVVMNDPKVNEPADVQCSGMCRVVAGAVVPFDSYVTTDAAGKAIVAVTGTNSAGIALITASTGEHLEIMLSIMNVPKV